MAGLYLHIPYCKQTCSYCDFYFSTNRSSQPGLVDALVKEVALEASFFPTGAALKTLYLGGGTPSLLAPHQLASLFDAIYRTWPVATDAEITLEANPDDVRAETIVAWQAVGINRISLGVQSFDDAVLAWMRRAHSGKQALHAIQHLQDAGFTNLTLDLIYHLPGQTLAAWEATLHQALSLLPQHLSCYGLTLEPNTLLGHQLKKGQLTPAPDAAFLAQYQVLLDATQSSGLVQYEVSSFATPGFESQHNSSYWAGKPYLGLGPAAHSFDGLRTRRWNIPSLHPYTEALHKGRTPPRETEQLTDAQRLTEILFTRLRTTNGLQYLSIPSSLRAHWLAQTATLRAGFVADGSAQQTPDGFRLTPVGLTRADGIAGSLML